jgi:hypothetical protein
MVWVSDVGLGERERAVGDRAGKEKWEFERSFRFVDFEVKGGKEREEEMERLRECERAWPCLAPTVEGSPLPSLKLSNLFLAAASSLGISKAVVESITKKKKERTEALDWEWR